jgi:hypothetical protein
MAVHRPRSGTGDWPTELPALRDDSWYSVHQKPIACDGIFTGRKLRDYFNC